MICYSKYISPLGAITLAGDNDALTGLWFDGQKYFPSLLSCTEKDLPLFGQVRDWLERYFRGENPPIDFPIRTEGSPFRQQVWKLLRTIPYGKTVTYAQKHARHRPWAEQSAIIPFPLSFHVTALSEQTAL